MAYDFRNLVKESDKMRIIIDGDIFDPTQNYDYKVSCMTFENTNGKVTIEGSFSLPSDNMRIPDLVKISKFSIRMDESFVQKNTKYLAGLFNTFRIEIILYNVTDELKFLKNSNFEQYLIDNKVDMDCQGKKIRFIANQLFKKFDLKPFKETSYEVHDQKGVYAFNLEDAYSYDPKRKIFKNEQGDNQSYEYEFPNNSEIREVPESPKIYQERKRNFINFNNPMSDFEFSEHQEKYNNPYKFNGSQSNINKKLRIFQRNFHNNSFRVSFNHRGEFITRGTFDEKKFHYNLKIQKIVPNKILESKDKTNNLIQIWTKNTIFSYMNHLNEKIEFLRKVSEPKDTSISRISPINHIDNSVFFRTNKKNPFLDETNQRPEDLTFIKMNINDYTSIINSLVEDLNSTREKLLNINSLGSEKELKVLKEKIEKEISILKLFKYLFLNCFLGKNDSFTNTEANINNTNSLNEVVKRMRKKKVLDWLYENTQQDFDSYYSHQSKSTDPKNIYNVILYCLLNGRISEATELAYKNGLLNLSMMISQSNMTIRAKLVKNSIESWARNKIEEKIPGALRTIYDLISANQNKEIIEKCDWRSLIMSSSIFNFPLSSNLSTIQHHIVTTMKKSSDQSKFSLEVQSLYNRDIKSKNLSFLLISLYSSMEEKSKNNQIKEILKEICNTLSISSSFTDHHLQYIIISILFNTIKETYDTSVLRNELNYSPIEQNYLKNFYTKLLLKCVEELLLNEEFNSWKYAISLVKYSNLSDKHKSLIIEDIVYRNVDVAVKDKSYFKIFDPTKTALGLYNLYRFKFQEAYECFMFSKNYDIASEIFLFNFFCKKLLSSNNDNQTNENFELMARECKNIYYWEKYGNIFKEYLDIFNKWQKIDRKTIIDSEMYEKIIQTIKKVETLNISTEIIYYRILTLCRIYILSSLRDILNSKFRLRINDQESNFTLVPYLVWIQDKNLTQDVKLKEVKSCFDSMVVEKRKIFKN